MRHAPLVGFHRIRAAILNFCPVYAQLYLWRIMSRNVSSPCCDSLRFAYATGTGTGTGTGNCSWNRSWLPASSPRCLCAYLNRFRCLALFVLSRLLATMSRIPFAQKCNLYCFRAFGSHCSSPDSCSYLAISRNARHNREWSGP